MSLPKQASMETPIATCCSTLGALVVTTCTGKEPSFSIDGASSLPKELGLIFVNSKVLFNVKIQY